MKTGKLTVYTGPMYSSKTTSLIGELTIALDRGLNPLVVKPIIDNRYSNNDIVSHDGVSITKMTNLKVIRLPIGAVPDLDHLDGIDIIFIDEAQFFINLGTTVDAYLKIGIDVVAVGLDMDSNGKPFGSMPTLLAKANNVYKLTGKCSCCKEPSTRTYRKPSASSKEQVFVGGEESYEARCFEHWSSV